ncbi:glycoside hydrolase family 3 protein [Leucobacter allii]|uniref:glycoside hydrolase family 3 N-terminal domain-containing protein n=1 Tax=Leucobacter allii TaxID=2932247 RepID=UPI001FD22BE2|nr:glycoside hydrolase family 3 N-terminal domain-containing protein [Leucobacter allii]UOR03170.1 glycoside hydrolase family 3 protein [Leucobacter allii]
MRLRRFAALLALSALLAGTGCGPSAAGPAAGSDAVETPPRATDDATPEAPDPTPEEALRERAEAYVDARSTRERAAGIVMAAAPGTDAGALAAFAAETGVGGLILMGDNVPADASALAQLTGVLSAAAEPPLLIAADQEGGSVSRLAWDALPAGAALQSSEPAASEAAFAERAALLANAGIDVSFGIVADVPRGPESFIAERALGATPQASAERVAAAVRGDRGLVRSTLKHFPGHGAAEGDSHVGIPSTPEPMDDWRASDALPFRAGIDAGAELLMFGHVAYTAVDAAPASLSAEWHRVAREELGFTGVAVTDDLGMLLSSGVPEYADPAANAVAALAAGNDLILVIAGHDRAAVDAVIAGLAAAVDSGTVPEERLREAALRVAELRLAGPGELPGPREG